jgi:ubiquitin-protein ligase
MNKNSRIRIQKDFYDMVVSLKKTPDLFFEEDPECKLEDIRDMTNFTIILKGPIDSPYQGGKFRLKIKVPQDYPVDPPSIKILTKTFHPNIKDTSICLDILDNNWKPTYNMIKVFESIYYLLKNPNSNDPLSPDVNSMYQKNFQLYLETAKLWTENFAK